MRRHARRTPPSSTATGAGPTPSSRRGRTGWRTVSPSRGYARGDALGLASGNSAEFLAVYYACAKIGLVCVPINLGWRGEEVAYVLGHSKARGIVVESQLVAPMSEGIAKATDVADVIVAPGTGVAYELDPADRTWSVLSDVAAEDSSPPEVFVDDRDPLSYLYTSGHDVVPEGRRVVAPGDHDGVDVHGAWTPAGAPPTGSTR